MEQQVSAAAVCVSGQRGHANMPQAHQCFPRLRRVFIVILTLFPLLLAAALSVCMSR